MVNMDVVMTRLARGLYTGVGAVVTGGIGNFLGDKIDSNKAVAAGEIALGAGVSIGVDEVFSSPDSIPNDAIEHVGYGMQAVGWDELAEDMNLHPVGAQTGAEVINVRSHADDAKDKQTGASGSTKNQAQQKGTRGEYSLQTA